MFQESANAPLVVLVVEDEALIRELVMHALEDGGFSVEPTANGDEAIAILERKDGPEYRALVTDIDLASKTTGWDVAHRARELHPDLPIVYMTGAKAGGSANGVPNSVLVTKPFAPAQIVTAISQLLNAGNTPGA
jgi:CheY-like chemotaxis protein